MRKIRKAKSDLKYIILAFSIVGIAFNSGCVHEGPTTATPPIPSQPEKKTQAPIQPQNITPTQKPSTLPISTQLKKGISDASKSFLVPPLKLQEPGKTFTEPTFGTAIRRVSSSSDDGQFEVQIYSQLQAFSADNSYVLLTGSKGYGVRRVDDLSEIKGLNLADINLPRWHPTQPHMLVHFDTNADNDLTLQFTNVDTKKTQDVATLPGYQRIFNNPSFDELSDDGRWLAGIASRNDGAAVIFTYDMISKSFGTQLAISDLHVAQCKPDPDWGQVQPDWVSPSPLGDYLVVQWKRDGTERCSGLEVFDIKTGKFVGRVNDGHQHGDLGIAPDGRQFFMTYEIYHPSGNAAVGVRYLPGTSRVEEPKYVLVLEDWMGDHISCRNTKNRGFCVITSTEGLNGQHNPLESEIFLLWLDGEVGRLVHHRSNPAGSYWAQPKATISQDGRFVIFSSNWGRFPGEDRVDAYVIDLSQLLG